MPPARLPPSRAITKPPARYEQSLEIRRALDDQPHTASLLSNLGILARFRGDLQSA
jgi:hypothetical protein